MQAGTTWVQRNLIAQLKRLAQALGIVSGSIGSINGVPPQGKDLSFAQDLELQRTLNEFLMKEPDTRRQLLSMLALGVHDTTPEDEKYRIAEQLSAAIYPKYKFSEFGRLFLEDQSFLSVYKRFMDPDNWHSLDRKYTLDQLLRLTLHIDGDVAECGVYQGATAYLICRAIESSKKRNYLFDSFEGLSAPLASDGNYWFRGALRADDSEVRENLREFKNFTICRGWIPERFPEVADKQFSFVHIDVDLYEPTRDSINFFYDRLSPGGVILFDDYGFKSCPGAKLATDEFFTHKRERIIMLPTGQAFIIRRNDVSP
ncbi:MAG: hypothetical protein EXR70_02955 [Deltaproteobacteria bacterium]|nr:hypothetical protein [Deltaproteobacteria bacterium]